MLSQQSFYDLNCTALAHLFVFALAPLDRNVPTISPHLHVGTRSQEGVAANLLAPFHGLEQESIRLVGRNRKEGRDRRQQVSRDRLHHRHERGLAGQARKFFVVGMQHELSHYIEEGAQRPGTASWQKPCKITFSRVSLSHSCFACPIVVLPGPRPVFSSAIFLYSVPIHWQFLPAGRANSVTSFTTVRVGFMCTS